MADQRCVVAILYF